MNNELDAVSVRIPVRVENGFVRFFYPGPLPRIRDGTVGDLVIDRAAVLDQKDLERLQFEEDVQILDAHTTLRVVVSPRTHIRGAMPRDEAAERMDNGSATHFVEVELLDALVLRLRGTKSAVLRPARCAIHALGVEAPTLNQAYSLIAGHFEPWRESTTGNVFKKVYYKTDRKPPWRRLGDLRDAAEADLESRLFRPQVDLLHNHGSGRTGR